MPDPTNPSGSIDDGERDDRTQPPQRRLDSINDQSINSLLTAAFTAGGGIRSRESPVLLQQFKQVAPRRLDRDDPRDLPLVWLYEKHHAQIAGKVQALVRHSLRGREAEIIVGDPYVLDVDTFASNYDQAVAWRFDINEGGKSSACLIPDIEFLEGLREGTPLAPERFDQGAAALCVILYMPSEGHPSTTPYFFSAQYDRIGLAEAVAHLRTAYASQAHIASSLRAHLSETFEVDISGDLSRQQRLLNAPTVIYAREHTQPPPDSSHHLVRLFGNVNKFDLRTGRSVDSEVLMMDYDISIDQGGFLRSSQCGAIKHSSLSRILGRLDR